MNKFQILSWNVQGLRWALSKKFKGRVRQELYKFNVGVCDMIFNAPNSGGGRKEFWFKIGSDLQSVDHWCMVGDFNMIENFDDRIGGSHALIGATELVTW